MNRETKRTMQRHRQLEADGATTTTQSGAPARAERVAAEPPKREISAQRHSPMQYLREVRDELRQVAWPTRQEMFSYTTVVFTTLVIMIALIFVLNYVFGKGVLFMFQK